MSADRQADGAQTLERGLRALRLLAETPAGLTASEVSRALGIHRSVAYRLLMTLVRERFASRDAEARYRAGAELVRLAEHVRPALREVAEPLLKELARQLDAVACLMVRDGDEVVAISVVEPPSPGPRLSYRLGSRDPLAQGAGGIAVLAAEPPSPDELPRVRTARAAGYVLSSGEVLPGAHAIAAPILARHPEGPACVTLITHRREVAQAAIEPVMDVARRIASALTP
ncbi:MAG: IclR family transcriptional regulator [Myxococcaceae bacterium]